MKNIHLITTEPNDETGKGIWISSRRDWCNIYITSSEEIKEGDWFLSDFNSFPLHNIKELSERKDSLGWKQEDLKNNLKIILTTDPTLIADGVQGIDDEFLEWFVKNPTCEFVEVNKKLVEFPLTFKMMYKIIIPQKESKQETLEEAAENYSVTFIEDDGTAEVDFIAGAKWQAERMYSEEEVIELLTARCKHFGTTMTPFRELLLKQDLEWFEQFKKK
jgi:hypothetical protein